ncbi:hypothetical protein DEO72_LG11g2335 [Vigna unguiculata]|uniref:Uncharacterized protein n=1 Tax=Vigna unguiculata TaxID=3917 RepID=A0A4D6NNY5_VIGUN|nr:hypothetical protein DEO72_LG11g2335 [Vigna unguiculata]
MWLRTSDNHHYEQAHHRDYDPNNTATPTNATKSRVAPECCHHHCVFFGVFVESCRVSGKFQKPPGRVEGPPGDSCVQNPIFRVSPYTAWRLGAVCQTTQVDLPSSFVFWIFGVNVRFGFGFLGCVCDGVILDAGETWQKPDGHAPPGDTSE